MSAEHAELVRALTKAAMDKSGAGQDDTFYDTPSGGAGSSSFAATAAGASPGSRERRSANDSWYTAAASPLHDRESQRQRREKMVSQLGFPKKLKADGNPCRFLPSRWDSDSNIYMHRRVKTGTAGLVTKSELVRNPVVIGYGSDPMTGQLASSVSHDGLTDEQRERRRQREESAAKQQASAADYFGEFLDGPPPKPDTKGALMRFAPFPQDSATLNPNSPFSRIDVASMSLSRRVTAVPGTSTTGVGVGTGTPMQPLHASFGMQAEGRPMAEVPRSVFDTKGVCDLRDVKTLSQLQTALQVLAVADAPLPQQEGSIVHTIDMRGVRLGKTAEREIPYRWTSGEKLWWGDEPDVEEVELNYRSEALRLVFPFLSTSSPAHHVKVLKANDCELHDVDAAALAQLLRHKPTTDRPKVQIETLVLAGNNFEEDGIDLLKKAVKYNEFIHQIDVQRNRRVPDNCEYLQILQQRLTNNINGVSNLSALQRLLM